ncbi:MAG: hypothetical protein ACJAUH_001480 [Saprospiraceae bacterium]|jgi:hypothetical protein
MLKIKFLFLALLLTSLTYAQDLKFGEHIVVGTPLTYILHNNQEFTRNNNIAANLNKSLYFGLGYRHLYTQGSTISLYSDYK